MNLEQKRAQEAFRVAGSAVEGGGADNFLSYARALPAMLQTNGLLASWAYLLIKSGKGEKGAKLLLASLVARLETRVAGKRAAALWPGGKPEGFLGIGGPDTQAPALSGAELRTLTSEAIQSAVWLKRAAEALCDGVKGAEAPSAQDAEARS
jgi:hypothetical protein